MNDQRTAAGPSGARQHAAGALRGFVTVIVGALLTPQFCSADGGPFFVTYTHQMEEPGNLEIATEAVTARPVSGSRFLGSTTELEYGMKTWWTSAVYLESQATAGEGGVFTGYRWENRFRVLPREHWINPVLYLEFANVNEANRSLREIVNHDAEEELLEEVSETRHEKERELEARLILSSYFKGWTIAENFVGEKNLRHEPFEFGYAVGISRPLALAARPDRCNFCRENFQAGVEVYGGLGTHARFGLSETSHYLAPAVAWTLANGTTFKVAPGFGLTHESLGFLLRFGVSYEIDQFGRAVRQFISAGER